MLPTIMSQGGSLSYRKQTSICDHPVCGLYFGPETVESLHLEFTGPRAMMISDSTLLIYLFIKSKMKTFIQTDENAHKSFIHSISQMETTQTYKNY
jgi:hypothetical protein